MRYRIEREIGRGGMAVVYAAHDHKLGRQVALKVLARELADEPDFRLRFLREARIAAGIRHPNVVRVFDVTHVDGLPCIVMELLDGGTLEGGNLSLSQAAAVADGLAQAHVQGVVHRDLKPANLLRGADGSIRIADFGIARVDDETRVTRVGTVLGTPRYLAPEQAAGHDVDATADVYSLGIVLDELLLEQPPSIRAVLERCRSIQPSSRPSAAAVAARLRDTNRDAATIVLAAVSSRVDSGRRRRRSLLAIVLAAAVAAVAGGLGVATYGYSPSPVKARVVPVARSADSAQQARNLVAWLRRYSR